MVSRLSKHCDWMNEGNGGWRPVLWGLACRFFRQSCAGQCLGESEGLSVAVWPEQGQCVVRGDGL